MKYPLLLALALLFFQCGEPLPEPILNIESGDHIVLVGGNLCSQMDEYGHFETELYLRYPEHDLMVRNLCDPGDTPGFRPHSSRMTAWVYPGAAQHYAGTELERGEKTEGEYPTPEEWLEELEADVILGFFGYSESFGGPDRLEAFKADLRSWVDFTLLSEYNGTAPARIALISPAAYQDKSAVMDLPDGQLENENLKLYTEAVREVAAQTGVAFLDIFTPTKEWFTGNTNRTTDGVQLTSATYKKLAPYVLDRLFGAETTKEAARTQVQSLVKDKQWLWRNDYKMPNGVHVYGRRHNPFGPDNYPYEIKKIRQMGMIRDTAIWKTLRGEAYDIAAADAKTHNLPPVETNYTLNGDDPVTYLYGKDALNTFTVADGYKLELFASEKEFPELANPCQISFDNKGRLWVAVMPTYPHYKPGDARPDDKLIILEDTDNDGKADKSTVFADDLHVPVGFELAPEGVYVSQGTNLKLLKDTDGDDKYDEAEIILSGFDDHDTHHTTSAFTTDPSGAILMGEGIFLHTNVETPYGPVRATDGGFYRLDTRRRHLERVAQIGIPNPWGIMHDQWGQSFFLHTSGPSVQWLMPSTIRNRYATQAPMGPQLIPEDDRVRPTSGLEFVSSRHFPDEVQGDMLYNNTIGFLGTKQFSIKDDGIGYKLKLRHDLISSTDQNYRPVDLEFAPDGSLYIADWHNVLVGHMQHNARDPLRDHQHGRIYRITYPSRPLVTPADVDGAPITTLLDNLKLPEYRSRYRSQRELRGWPADEVVPVTKAWVATLDKADPNYEAYLLEALWATWGQNRPDQDLLEMALQADDFRVRAAAVQVLRYDGGHIANRTNLLNTAAGDEHGRVRLAAMVAATWLPEDEGRMVLNTVNQHEIDPAWMKNINDVAMKHLTGEGLKASKAGEIVVTHLRGKELEQFSAGWDIYHEDGSCVMCHQKNGKGLKSSGFPPLLDSEWVLEDPKVLAKILLKGMIGPVTVNGKEYPGQVPMTPYENLLNDEEIAAVMTYVRNAFSNRASAVTPEFVEQVRAEVKASGHEGYYRAEELEPASR
jgi:glucose/arabinose dehydrogenase/mono/diheme cytochrome c family protein